MNIPEIRIALLDEHAVLRSILCDAIVAAERCRRGVPAREELLAVLRRLSTAFAEHNAHEEELLREIVPKLDAWGSARTEVMLEEHVQEHAEMRAAVQAAETTADMGETVLAVGRLTMQMREHIANEELTFLSEELLNDNAVPPEVHFGG
jgi:hypothetical protein